MSNKSDKMLQYLIYVFPRGLQISEGFLQLPCSLPAFLLGSEVPFIDLPYIREASAVLGKGLADFLEPYKIAMKSL